MANIPIKISSFKCPSCKRGNGFVKLDDEYIKCDSCNAILPNPLLDVNENQHFSIQFVDFIYEEGGKLYINDIDDLEFI